MVAASVDFSNLNVKVNAGNGNVVTVKGMLDMSKVGVYVKHAGDSRNFVFEGKVVYMDNKQVSGTMEYKRKGSSILVELRTPFTGYEMTQYFYREKISKKQASVWSKFTYGNNQIIQSTVKIGYAPKYEMLTTIDTPFQGYE